MVPLKGPRCPSSELWLREKGVVVSLKRSRSLGARGNHSPKKVHGSAIPAATSILSLPMIDPRRSEILHRASLVASFPAGAAAQLEVLSYRISARSEAGYALVHVRLFHFRCKQTQESEYQFRQAPSGRAKYIPQRITGRFCW